MTRIIRTPDGFTTLGQGCPYRSKNPIRFVDRNSDRIVGSESYWIGSWIGYSDRIFIGSDRGSDFGSDFYWIGSWIGFLDRKIRSGS